MKLIIRILIVLLTSSLLLIFGSFIWIKPQWKRKISELEMERIIDSIKSYESVPKEFVDLYYKVNSAQKKSFLRARINNSNSSCGLAFRLHSAGLKPFEYVSAMLEFETRVSQEECLSCVLAEYDFLYQAIGKNAASHFYFKKDLQSLTLDEQLTLIVMLKNSSLYNPLKRPELVQEKVEALKNNLNLGR